MALQLSTTVRNAALDQIETTISTSPSFIVFSGSVTADCAAADPTGTLATITCPSDWLAAASSGSKTLLGSWTATASGGSATAPASWRIKQGATCHMQGTAAVGSGDVNFNGSITSGQTVTVTAFTLSAGNA
jgi:hypothetical protein